MPTTSTCTYPTYNLLAIGFFFSLEPILELRKKVETMKGKPTKLPILHYSALNPRDAQAKTPELVTRRELEPSPLAKGSFILINVLSV